MGRVIHSLNITANGTCHHADTVADEEHHRYALDVLAHASAALFGRSSFDLLASFWPEAVNRTDLPPYMIDFAAELDSKPKGVVSSHRVDTKWKHTKWLQGPGLENVRQFVASIPGSIVMFGSPKLGASLVAAGLVDEIHLVMQPYLGLVPVRAFEGLSSRTNLSLLEARPFQSGAVLLRYEIKA